MKKNKIWMAVLLLMAFASCVKTEYHYLDDSLKEWFVDRDKADFQVRDQNGVTQQFHFLDTTADMIPGWSYFLFVKTGDDLFENIHQNGQVTYFKGSACSLNVTGYETSTYFSLCFYDLQYYIDFEEGVFTCSSGRDELLNRNVSCTMELLDSHEVNGQVYHDVMHFKVTDWASVSARTTFPSELYYAQHYGPIEYELGGNVRIKRI